MAKKMKWAALFSTLITICFIVVYKITGNGGLFTLSITFGTISYHFVMRLFTGWMIDHCLHNCVNYRRKWFQVSTTELKMYEKLKVKKWKGKVGAYDPGCFDPKIHSWDEIAQATCQAELVHELIILLSFLPVFAAISFGAFPVFVITSVLAACIDGIFVIIQRYNRPRILKLLNRNVNS